ncbi:MAG TPA: type III secretion system stator protein SctL [Thermoanaerobaculia bacterium]|nr:type III secretion system stator protein SctL [Thermoanaerobaculia bacterium]
MAKIIKGSGAAPQPAVPRRDQGKVIEQEVLLAHDEARRIVEQAQARARAIVEDAQRAADALEREARDRGRGEGLAQWQEKVAAVAEEGRRAMEEIRPQLVTLALKVAEKVLRRRLEIEPEAVVPMVEEALEAARGYRGGHLVVRVHPDDAASLEGFRRRLLDRDPRWQSLEVVPEEEMTRGGCRIETDFGTIDASVETQLKAIEHLLLAGERP